MPSPDEYIERLTLRLKNPAVPTIELRGYLQSALNQVNQGFYTSADFDEQVLDTACQFLLTDNKFPEVGSISANGISTSFTSDGAERFKQRIAQRRKAAWMGKMLGNQPVPG